jgi:hypothetical protein
MTDPDSKNKEPHDGMANPITLIIVSSNKSIDLPFQAGKYPQWFIATTVVHYSSISDPTSLHC